MLNERIAALLKQHSITQHELAQELGVSPSSVSNWISGRNRPQIDMLDKLCNGFGVSKQELLGLYTPGGKIPEIPKKPENPNKPKISEQLMIPIPAEKKQGTSLPAKSIDAKTMAFIFEHLDFIKHMAANRDLYNQFLKFAGAGIDLFSKRRSS